MNEWLCVGRMREQRENYERIIADNRFVISRYEDGVKHHADLVAQAYAERNYAQVRVMELERELINIGAALECEAAMEPEQGCNHPAVILELERKVAELEANPHVFTNYCPHCDCPSCDPIKARERKAGRRAKA